MTQLYKELETQLSRIARNLREPTVLDDGTVVYRATASVLYLLAESDPIRVGAVARALGVDPSTTTRQVQNAVQLGLVERVSDPRDRRVSLLALTPAGHDLHDRIVIQQRRGLAHLLNGWADNDKTDLVRLLSRFNAEVARSRMGEAGEVPDGDESEGVHCGA